MIWLPTIEHVLRLHTKLVARTGGSVGVRDVGLIESALARPKSGYGDVELYPIVDEKAAALCCGLIGNHGFVDGNKRIGVAVMLLVLAKNGVSIRYTQDELINLGLSIALGQIREKDVVGWIVHRRG